MENQDLRRKTPIMGWASWNCFRTNINEGVLKKQADALVNTGLADCGYEYFNVDDGFYGGRGKDGRIQSHKERFPNGIKVIADYAHALGLKAGIYAEGGDKTCGFYYDSEEENGDGVGLYGYEEQDLRMYLQEYDFDFIKVDWCGGLRMGLDEEEQYTKIGQIIHEIRRETGKPIVYNVCRWQFPGEWVVDVADSWRTGADIQPEFVSILHQIDNIKPLEKYCGPGHVNDLDMMQIGNGLTLEEEKTHFSMWCMLSAPLMIGCDLTKIAENTLKILKNREMIGIDQDMACQQAFLTKQIISEQEVLGEIWLKNLEEEHSAKKAVAFLNRSDLILNIRAKISELGLAGKVISVRDVWKQEEMEAIDEYHVTVPPHGVVVYVVKAEACGKEVNLCEDVCCTEIKDMVSLTDDQARELLNTGAILIDVREREEYEAYHLDGAINIPYTEIHANGTKYLEDRERAIIVYCMSGKRCKQAKQSLKYLGYKEVYDWRIMEQRRHPAMGRLDEGI